MKAHSLFVVTVLAVVFALTPSPPGAADPKIELGASLAGFSNSFGTGGLVHSSGSDVTPTSFGGGAGIASDPEKG